MDLKSKYSIFFSPNYTKPSINRWNMCLSKSTSNTFVINICKDKYVCKVCLKRRITHSRMRWKFFPDGNQCATSDTFLNTFEEFVTYINNLI